MACRAGAESPSAGLMLLEPGLERSQQDPSSETVLPKAPLSKSSRQSHFLESQAGGARPRVAAFKPGFSMGQRTREVELGPVSQPLNKASPWGHHFLPGSHLQPPAVQDICAKDGYRKAWPKV